MSDINRALVVIDVQQEYFDGPVSIQYPPLDISLPRIVETIEAAVGQGLPIVVVQHSEPESAPVFARGSRGWQLHPDIEAKAQPDWKRIEKSMPSAFVGTGLQDWLTSNGIDTITLVGYMTNNCIQATANHALNLGIAVEILGDATGAIGLANEAGAVSAEDVHRALLVLLQSNYAAVTSAQEWIAAVSSGATLARSNLLFSSLQARGQDVPA